MVKGFDQVIRALAEMPNYTFYIAGGGHQVEMLRQLALRYSVENRVFFVGFQKNITSFIDKMDLFVVSSRSEGFPLAMLEIARGKKPIVCSRIPIFEELFDNTEVVFFDLDNTKSLTEAIEKISKKNKVYVQNAYQKFISIYTSDKMALGYTEVYKRLMNEESGVVL
jgi:glycosyltransferase involved in cell wall biosynthesis